MGSSAYHANILGSAYYANILGSAYHANMLGSAYHSNILGSAYHGWGVAGGSPPSSANYTPLELQAGPTYNHTYAHNL